MHRQALVIVFAVYCSDALSICTPTDNPDHPCRYSIGDSWCIENAPRPNDYAYRSRCLEEHGVSEIGSVGSSFEEITDGNASDRIAKPLENFGSSFEEIAYGLYVDTRTIWHNEDLDSFQMLCGAAGQLAVGDGVIIHVKTALCKERRGVVLGEVSSPFKTFTTLIPLDLDKDNYDEWQPLYRLQTFAQPVAIFVCGNLKTLRDFTADHGRQVGR